jgi:hypothetical protein
MGRIESLHSRHLFQRRGKSEVARNSKEGLVRDKRMHFECNWYHAGLEGIVVCKTLDTNLHMKLAHEVRGLTKCEGDFAHPSDGSKRLLAFYSFLLARYLLVEAFTCSS